MAGIVLNDGQIIRNIPGIGPCPKPYYSWKKYLMNRSGRHWTEKCSNKGCTNDATDGGLVMVPSILPLCHSCNIGKLNQNLQVDANAIAVPLHQSLL